MNKKTTTNSCGFFILRNMNKFLNRLAIFFVKSFPQKNPN